MADEVLLLLPERLPHKDFAGADFEARLRMLERAVDHERVSVGSTPGGLFLEIASACAMRFPESKIALVCGRDAAERILNWSYPEERALDRLFSMVTLWVYARQGSFSVPQEFAAAMIPLDFEEELQSLSATEVRRRAAEGEEWRELVPASIHGDVERIYARKAVL
jgi:nicotinic acid mononucleotide adenylyltransferase